MSYHFKPSNKPKAKSKAVKLIAPPYLAFTIKRVDYVTISKHLLEPSFIQELTSQKGDKVLIAYLFNQAIISPNQWLWLAKMKQGIKENLKANIQTELIINAYDEPLRLYTLKELCRCFKSADVFLPKLHFTSDRKAFYERLKQYAIRLLKRDLLSFEFLYSGAIKLNENLTKHNQNLAVFSDRELQKKCNALIKNLEAKRDDFLVDKEKLKEQHKKGGEMSGAKRKEQMQEIRQTNETRVKKLIDEYKAKGLKINKSKIAKALNLTRPTIHSIITAIGASCFLLIPSDLLQMLNYTQQII